MRLQKRFVDFVAAHISDTFFVEEARGRQQALRPSELSRSLRNTYQIRSNYVHMLEPIPDFLRLLRLRDSDLFKFRGEPYLTFAGLLRVAHHAIGQFIFRGDCLEKEEYAWRRDLPGIVMLQMAPEYWIGRTEGFQPEQSAARLSGFLAMFQAFLTNSEPLVDLSELMQEYERLLPSAKQADRIPMVALYALFNAVVEERSEHYNEVLQREQRLLERRCIEMLVVRMLVDESLPWPVEECAEVFGTFRLRRFGKRAIVIPVLIELSLTVRIANEYLRAGNDAEYERWSHIAYLEAAGIESVQEYIGKRISERGMFDPLWVASRGRQMMQAKDLAQPEEAT